MKRLSEFTKISVVILFLFSFFLLFQHLIQGELFFDSDIGRDFLLFEDVLFNKSLTLIGPRADGIPGMFFGPYWIYMNIPVFLLSGGNPVAIAFSWGLLIILSFISIYYVASRIFNKSAGIIATLLFSFAMVPFSSGFTQSFFAVLLAPWLIYFISLFLNDSKPKHLILTLLIAGTIFQFQPAFGMITIPITLLIFTYKILIIRKFKYFLYYLFLFIPFAAFFLFEAKHNFIQTQAFLTHVFNSSEKSIELIEMFSSRYIFVTNIFNFSNITIIGSILLFITLFIVFKAYKDKTSIFKNYFLIYFAFVFGFFAMSFLFKGRFNDYHIWGFLPLTAIAFAGFYKYLNRKVYLALISIVLLIAIASAISFRVWWNNEFVGKDNLSWISNKEVSEYIFANKDTSFGYYIYSLDEFGYHMRYAMNYKNRQNGLIGNFCNKEEITYLIYYAQVQGTINDPDFWRIERIKINKEPEERIKIDDIVVEKYFLNQDEVNIQADPNIICNLHFR